MKCFREEVKPQDCPNCGKKHGAFMAASSWGHSISCCSNECGLAIAKKLKANKSSPEYKAALKEYEKAEKLVMKAKYKGISAVDFCDQIGNARGW